MKVPTKKSIIQECSNKHPAGHYFSFKDCVGCNYYKGTRTKKNSFNRNHKSSCFLQIKVHNYWHVFPLEFQWNIKNFKQRYLQYLIEHGRQDET